MNWLKKLILLIQKHKTLKKKVGNTNARMEGELKKLVN